MALPLRPNNKAPIPNQPFSSPLNLYVSGPYFPVVMGAGIDITNDKKVSSLNNDGVLDFSGITGAINLVSGPGVSVVEASGTDSTDFTISNTGVLELIAGGNVSITGSNGSYTISATDAQTGTVTSVATGAGLTGGPITTSGTISLDSSGVTPGSYTYPSITVDAYGRLTVATNGATPVTSINGTAPVQVTGSAPTLSIAVGAASTVASGVVQLNDSTNSTSTTQALTANAGSVLQQQINALAVSSNITLAGTIDASTGFLATVTTEGAANGFTVGSPLPAADTANDNYFTIVTVAGTMTPPGGSAQICHVGDWWLSNGAIWQFLDVAAPAPVVASATPTTEGVVFGHTDNTTNYNTSLGYDALLAPTASGVANVALGFAAGNAVSNGYGNTLVGGGTGCALTDGTVNVAVGFGAFSGATTAFANAVFGICSGCAYTVESGNAILGGYYGDAGDTNTVTLSDGAGNLKAKFDSNGALSFDGTTFGTSGQVLTSNGSGAKPTWQAVPAGGIPCSTITGKGAIVTGTSASTPSALPVGNYGEVLIADSGCATGLKWGAVPAAGPIGRGTVFGCTMDTSGANNLAIGYYSLAYTSATCSVVIGNSAMIGSNGLCHIAIGTGIGATGSGTDCNVLVGNAIGSGMFQNSSKNVVLGHGAGKACFNASNGNVVIGAGAGPNLDMSCQNVVIGCGVTIPTTGTDCALAIGFATGCHWLTGDSTKAIKPGAGIIDCSNSAGTAGQVLMSNGSNAICWGTVAGCLGTVTSVTAGIGLTGGTITDSGTIALDTACVIQPSAFTAKGDLLSASAAATPTALGVGTDGQILSACSACASGLVWATPASGVVQISTSNSYAFTAGTPVRILNFATYNTVIDGTLTIPLNGYSVNAVWKFVKSGDPTNFNTGWNPYFAWPVSSTYNTGSFYVDIPVYPDPLANNFLLTYTPAETATVSMTLIYTVIAGIAPTWMI